VLETEEEEVTGNKSPGWGVGEGRDILGYLIIRQVSNYAVLFNPRNSLPFSGPEVS
jgi:hypothetical protein